MKKHLTLIIGVSLPIIFIIIIAIVIFVPSLSIKPEHNFVYVDVNSNNNYYSGNVYKNSFVIKDGKIVKEPASNLEYLQEQNKKYTNYKLIEAPTLYLYNVIENTAKQITLDEANNYTFDPGPSSPDGYTVKFERNSDGIFEIFGSNNNSSGYFIEKNRGKKKLTGLTLENGNYYYNSNFQLIGWIK